MSGPNLFPSDIPLILIHIWIPVEKHHENMSSGYRLVMLDGQNFSMFIDGGSDWNKSRKKSPDWWNCQNSLMFCANSGIEHVFFHYFLRGRKKVPFFVQRLHIQASQHAGKIEDRGKSHFMEDVVLGPNGDKNLESTKGWPHGVEFFRSPNPRTFGNSVYRFRIRKSGM